ncbi:MAG: hemerythrin domain-containing protein [Comamonas sp.]|nr:hemerythrin domain-containing protein [Comamonas sp.]
MNIEKFKHQHVSILQHLADLRKLSQAGVIENAQAIAQGVVAMGGIIKLHLAVEDQVLYPALQNSGNTEMTRLGQQFQTNMGPIADAFDEFARRWNTAHSVLQDPEGFRTHANTVLRRLHERMLLENREFYPRIEAMDGH